jgi:RimJ/RimL family protein N-acetyltransferase
MAILFPRAATLRDNAPVQLCLADERDVEPLKALYRLIVAEGTSYPHDRFPDHEEFMDYWFRGKRTVVAYAPDRARAVDLAGAFYLKPNWPGRAGHVANAGFIVGPAWRRRGLGWLLGTTMLEYACQLGYRAVIYNLVFSRNVTARRLWEQLGFTRIGTVPAAVRNDDGDYQDALIMYRLLIDRSAPNPGRGASRDG